MIGALGASRLRETARFGLALALTVLGAACDTKPTPTEPASPAPVTPASAAPASALPASPGRPSEPPRAEPAAQAAASNLASEPVASGGTAPRQFGAPLTVEGDPLDVEQVLAVPDPHLGKTVKCEGKVARVCQAAGCWLELQPEAGGEGLRVPMAAHAFFIPQEAVGKLAVVQGELKRRELPDAQKQHYQGEGMKAMGPLSLEATGVLLR